MNRMLLRFEGRVLAFGLAAYSLAVLFVSQIVLTIAPTDFSAVKDWVFIRMNKDSWQGLNFWFGVVFMLSLLLCFIFKKSAGGDSEQNNQIFNKFFRLEYAIVLCVCVLVFVGVLTDTPPLRTFYDLTLLAKRSW